MGSAMLNENTEDRQMKSGRLRSQPPLLFFWKVVSRAGLEPATHWLKA